MTNKPPLKIKIILYVCEYNSVLSELSIVGHYPSFIATMYYLFMVNVNSKIWLWRLVRKLRFCFYVSISADLNVYICNHNTCVLFTSAIFFFCFVALFCFDFMAILRCVLAVFLLNFAFNAFCHALGSLAYSLGWRK